MAGSFVPLVLCGLSLMVSCKYLPRHPSALTPALFCFSSVSATLEAATLPNTRLFAVFALLLCVASCGGGFDFTTLASHSLQSFLPQSFLLQLFSLQFSFVNFVTLILFVVAAVNLALALGVLAHRPRSKR